jgi:hypothetical protein
VHAHPLSLYYHHVQICSLQLRGQVHSLYLIATLYMYYVLCVPDRPPTICPSFTGPARPPCLVSPSPLLTCPPPPRPCWLVPPPHSGQRHLSPEAEFLDVIGTNVLRFSSLLFTVTYTNGFYLPPPHHQWFETGL